MKKNLVLRLLVLGLIFTFLLTAALPAANGQETVRVWVEFAQGGKADVQSALNGAGAQFHYEFDELNSFVVSLPSQALSGLSNNPNVVSIEEDPARYPVSIDASTETFSLSLETPLTPTGRPCPGASTLSRLATSGTPIWMAPLMMV